MEFSQTRYEWGLHRNHQAHTAAPRYQVPCTPVDMVLRIRPNIGSSGHPIFNAPSTVCIPGVSFCSQGLLQCLVLLRLTHIGPCLSPHWTKCLKTLAVLMYHLTCSHFHKFRILVEGLMCLISIFPLMVYLFSLTYLTTSYGPSGHPSRYFTSCFRRPGMMPSRLSSVPKQHRHH